MGLIASSCDHPVQPSPQPGVVKITLQHVPEDTMIEMAGKTNILTQNDRFPLTISEGRVVRANDSAYANLYQNMDEFRQQDHDYDILRLERDGTPSTMQIFETRIPPGEYTEVSFVMNTSSIRLVPPDEQPITQPVVLSPDHPQLPLVRVDADFTIEEQKTTIVRLRLSSFRSLTRFKDSFRFVPQLSVHRIQEP